MEQEPSYTVIPWGWEEEEEEEGNTGTRALSELRNSDKTRHMTRHYTTQHNTHNFLRLSVKHCQPLSRAQDRANTMSLLGHESTTGYHGLFFFFFIFRRNKGLSGWNSG